MANQVHEATAWVFLAPAILGWCYLIHLAVRALT